jgi:ketosteroid isomerase-like protein
LEDLAVKATTARLAIFFALLMISRMTLGSEQDATEVAALDTQYQAAVKSNDYAKMENILGNNFALVIGTGHVFTKADLIGAARKATEKWEHQEEIAGSRTVRVWGNTAVVTAELWIKGAFQGRALDEKVWFSDTYVRTRSGWKYVFGQASNPVTRGAIE